MTKQFVVKIFEDPNQYDKSVVDADLGIRDSHSAPLDETASRRQTPATKNDSASPERHSPSRRRAPVKINRRSSSAPPLEVEREDSTKFNPFRFVQH